MSSTTRMAVIVTSNAVSAGSKVMAKAAAAAPTNMVNVALAAKRPCWV